MTRPMTYPNPKKIRITAATTTATSAIIEKKPGRSSPMAAQAIRVGVADDVSDQVDRPGNHDGSLRAGELARAGERRMSVGASLGRRPAELRLEVEERRRRQSARTARASEDNPGEARQQRAQHPGRVLVVENADDGDEPTRPDE